MKKNLQLYFGILMLSAIFFASCNDDDERPDLPTTAYIHYSVDDKQVAFTALANNVTSYLWDFGDGQTSTEANPVHIYETGYYVAKLTVTGGTGSFEDEANLTIGAPPLGLLSGGPNAENGKTWKLSSSHSANDYFAYADAELSPFPGAPNPLPTGILGQGLGLGEVYEDEFTFYFDGRYEHKVKDDEASFASIVNQLALNGGANVVNWSSDTDFGLCTAGYTPEDNATFTLEEETNLDVPSVFDPSDGIVTYSGVTTLDFSGTEFIGFLDNQRKVIIQELTDDSMRLVLFMTGDPDYHPLNTNALVLTFVPVD